MKQISSLLFSFFLCVFSLFGKRPFAGNYKAEAVIINAAVGDALGRVTEFIDTTNGIEKQFGIQGVTSLSQVTIVHPISKQIVAPYTDDTVMALMVLKACTRISFMEGDWPTCAEKVMDELARECANLFGSEKYSIDPLYTLRAHGIRNAKAGAQLNELIASGKDQDPKWYLNRPVSDIPFEGGCGSVMRAWPLGLLPDEYENIVDLAHRQSELTHRHPMAIAASVAIAVGIAYAYKGKSVDEAVKIMIDMAELGYDKRELDYKKNAKKWPSTKKLTAAMVAKDQLLTSDMIRYAYQAAKEGKTPEEVLGVHNQKNSYQRSTEGYLLGWAADEAVAAAVYLFVRNSNNVDQALKEGVNTPGDSDSIASLAAALVTAHTGQLCSDSNLHLLENKNTLVELALLVSL